MLDSNVRQSQMRVSYYMFRTVEVEDDIKCKHFPFIGKFRWSVVLMS